jgi:hypothetical protein
VVLAYAAQDKRKQVFGDEFSIEFGDDARPEDSIPEGCG